MARQYDRKQVEEILRRAVRTQADPDGITHDDLVAAAAEVGITADAIERAAEDVEREAHRSALLDAVTRRRRRRFFRTLASYTALSVGMFVLNRVIGGDLWAQWVAVSLGIVLLMRGVKTFLPSEHELERAMALEERRVRKLQQRRARSHRQRVDQADGKRREAELERLLARGADALLRAADRQLEKLETSDRPRVRVDDSDSAHRERPRRRRHER